MGRTQIRSFFLLNCLALYRDKTMQNHWDVIIIGTGAGGSTLAYSLASTGKRILMLDRGDYIPREKANWNPEAVYMDGKYRTDERWSDANGNAFQPTLYHRIGGSTKVYGAALLRMRMMDFEALQHQEGVSPAWALKYEDYAPYYAQAEQLYKVHGQRGEDPTEPIAQPFPFPALPHEPVIANIADRLRQAGLHPFSLPMGIDRHSTHPESSPCIRCDTCDGYPCLVNAKADAQICCIEPALKHENVTLLPNVQVNRLVVSPSGQEIQAVEVEFDRKTETLTADLVVVACGAINSAALLLRSACDSHPQGLANASGQVGRNLMKHNVTKLFAISSQLNPTVFQKTLAINDFYFGTIHDPHPLGHVHLMGKHKWQMMRPDFPKWVPQFVLQKLAERSVDWWVQSEDLPDAENRVCVDAQGNIQVRYRPNNRVAHEQFKRRFKEVLRQIGFPVILEAPIPLKVLNHQVGTCRFGEDPATSVLDLNCRAHDVDNLYVVDSSFFPSISAINPTLTIVANALRVAEHMKQRLTHANEKALASVD
jgi:choline dehydrogenase-like flavoprotein